MLIDAGLGTSDVADPSDTLGDWFLSNLGPVLDPKETAVQQVRARGHRPEDVTDVVLTHADRDHAGGVADFPWARVHLSPAARAAVLEASTARDHDRIRRGQWAHAVARGTPPHAAADWRGLRSWTLPDVPDVLLVDLPGHSTGHAGVVLPTPEGFLLHAGDAYFHRGQLTGGGVPPGVRAFTESTEQDRAARIRTQELLAELARQQDITVTSAHDPAELRSLSDG